MNKNNRNLYEGMYAISAAISDEQRQRVIDEIQSDITQHGGEVIKIHNQGRKRLAYQIKGHRDAYYYVMYFELKPEAVDPLWAEYRLNNNILRFVTLRTDKVMEEIKFKPLGE
ncbi:MAG: 30S ribosomal protein S6 [Chlamydiales bacterium]